MKLLRKLRELLWGKRECKHCGGTRIAYRIPDPNTGRELKLPCPWCHDEDA